MTYQGYRGYYINKSNKLIMYYLDLSNWKVKIKMLYLLHDMERRPNKIFNP